MLDKILNGFGSILKFFGVMIGLIVVAAIIMTFVFTSDVRRGSHETEIKSISESSTKQEGTGLAQQLKLKITKIEGTHFNDIANAYGEAAITLEISNISGKTLKGFSGTISIRDAFGDLVKSAGYKHDEDVPPGVTTVHITLPLNLFDKSGQSIISLNRYSTEFKADTILTE